MQSQRYINVRKTVAFIVLDIVILTQLATVASAQFRGIPGEDLPRTPVDHTTDSKTLPGQSRRWAILIGVDDYNRAQDLKYCGADMVALRKQLIASGFDERRIFLLHDDANEKKHLPFKSNIEDQIELVLKLTGPDDLILLGFSGHGVQLGKSSYFCPTDAKLEDPQSLISLNSVYSQLEDSPAALRLVLVDACRNDPRPDGRKSLSATKSFNTPFARSLQQRPPEGIVLLTSCAAGEISWEEPELSHGVFMYHVLEALRGKADKDRDGKISLGELAMYAGEETELFVARRFSESQRPGLRGDLSIEALNFDFADLGLRRAITNTIDMKLRLIPAGEHMMGNGRSAAEIARQFDSKAEYFEDEHPQHRVTISRSYYLGAHEVTAGQFRKFVEASGYRTEAETDGEGGYGYNASEKKFEGRKTKYNWRNTGFAQPDSHPVVNVTWNDAQAFCRWLSKKEGVTYRLPTEAEWEYACRAGTNTLYYSGDDGESLAQVGNVADATAKSQISIRTTINSRDGYVFTAPAGQFRPNTWGLYDMHGNVWEWCSDWYDKDYYAGSPQTDPSGPAEGLNRALRGGSWLHSPQSCRSADRAGDSPGNRCNFLGFRVARSSVSK